MPHSLKINELSALGEFGSPDSFPDADQFLDSVGIPSLEEISARKNFSRGGVSAGVTRQTPVSFQLPEVISQEFRTLLLHYAASYTSAKELSQVNWAPMAVRLGTELEFIKEAAEALDSTGDRLGLFWHDVIAERIKRAGSAKLFRDVGWEKLESKAVMKLLELAESGRIRDVGELLAIAKVSRAVSQGNSNPHGGNSTSVQVNINSGLGLGDGEMIDDEGGLPGAGAKMTIDLSPRSAKNLSGKEARTKTQDRVIDGEMLNAEELRSILAERNKTESDTLTQQKIDFVANNPDTDEGDSK